MLISPADDLNLRKVTFEWSNLDPSRQPADVLVRMQTITDHAFYRGDLSPYLMHRNDSGDWQLTLTLPANLRVTYGFYRDFDAILRRPISEDDWFGPMRQATLVDPANPERFPRVGARPESSLLQLDQAPAQPWFQHRERAPAGTVRRHEFTSALLGNTRPQWTYEPAAASAQQLPVMLMLDGDCWIDADLPTTLDNLIFAGAIPPLYVLMVACLDKQTRTRELTGTGHEIFLQFLCKELMPWLAGILPISADPAQTIIAGQSFGGLTAAYAGLRAPHRFGLVLSQSGSFWWPREDQSLPEGRALIAAYDSAPPVPVRFYLEAGLSEWLLLDANRTMRNILNAKGCPLSYVEYQGGHDYACWRGGVADGLIHLLNPD